ncbi:hypothetical protein CCUS01_08900 [Colletotrichum cuscutae]|uniref:Uncharacterized protein n=1 Tax=Colletotrichum cuscutae TaxID=1209917 RepID=A0AAI9ULI2_9PEZI|nr:hypothetical protein CCUS01_08900 [Colletotrichum cuscutae]
MSEYLIKYPGIEASRHRRPIVAPSGNAATAEEFMTGTLTHVLNDRLPRNVAQRVQARVTANVVLAGDCCRRLSAYHGTSERNGTHAPTPSNGSSPRGTPDTRNTALGPCQLCSMR